MKLHYLLLCLSFFPSNLSAENHFINDIKKYAELGGDAKFLVLNGKIEMRVSRSIFDFDWKEVLVPGAKNNVKFKGFINSSDKPRNAIFIDLQRNGQLAKFSGQQLSLLDIAKAMETNSKKKNPTVILGVSSGIYPDPKLFLLLDEFSHKLAFSVFQENIQDGLKLPKKIQNPKK